MTTSKRSEATIVTGSSREPASASSGSVLKRAVEQCRLGPSPSRSSRPTVAVLSALKRCAKHCISAKMIVRRGLSDPAEAAENPIDLLKVSMNFSGAKGRVVHDYLA